MKYDITSLELKKKLDGGEMVTLLDVREQYEHEYVNLGGKLIPLQHLRLRFKELDAEQEIVVYCHHGNRSAYAANFLRHKGFKKVRNLAGGVDAWAETVDPSLPRY